MEGSGLRWRGAVSGGGSLMVKRVAPLGSNIKINHDF